MCFWGSRWRLQILEASLWYVEMFRERSNFSLSYLLYSLGSGKEGQMLCRCAPVSSQAREAILQESQAAEASRAARARRLAMNPPRVYKIDWSSSEPFPHRSDVFSAMKPLPQATLFTFSAPAFLFYFLLDPVCLLISLIHTQRQTAARNWPPSKTSIVGRTYLGAKASISRRDTRPTSLFRAVPISWLRSMI